MFESYFQVFSVRNWLYQVFQEVLLKTIPILVQPSYSEGALYVEQFSFHFFFFTEANHDIALHFFSVPAIYQSDSKRKFGSGFGFHANLNHCNQKQVIFKSALLQLL